MKEDVSANRIDYHYAEVDMAIDGEDIIKAEKLEYFNDIVEEVLKRKWETVDIDTSEEVYKVEYKGYKYNIQVKDAVKQHNTVEGWLKEFEKVILKIKEFIEDTDAKIKGDSKKIEIEL